MNIINYENLTPELAGQGCFVLGMPEDAYHSYPNGVSKSQLDLIDRSPAHLVYAQKREATRNMVIGSAIHCAILEPERFEQEYMVVTGINDRRKAEYKEAAKVHGGDFTLTQSEDEKVTGMQAAIHANPEASAHLNVTDSYTEISAFAKCPITGVQLRCRFDFLSIADQLAIDLKKTQDVRYDKFQRSVANYRYHVQDAFYSYVYELITGERLNFKFLAVEEEQPHANKLYTLDTEAKIIGKRLVMANLKTYAECESSDDWPGIAHEGELLSLPAWAIDEDEEEEIEL